MEQSKHGDGVTSVKVHHGPGGASSIQLGGGYGGEGSVLDKKPVGAAAAVEGTGGAAAADDEEEKKDDTQGAATGDTAGTAGAAGAGVVGDVRRVAEGTSTVTDAFGNKVSGTSVRVRAPPGGASSITF